MRPLFHASSNRTLSTHVRWKKDAVIFNRSGHRSFRGPFFMMLDILQRTKTVSRILTGTYHPGIVVDTATKEFIEHLAMPETIQALPLIDAVVSTASYMQGWKKMRSMTACSPFGPSFSDLIAGCDDFEVATIDAALTSIPLITGYCPVSCAKAVEMMIPKKQTATHVTKLRIITRNDQHDQQKRGSTGGTQGRHAGPHSSRCIR